jgi:hypothetical protein
MGLRPSYPEPRLRRSPRRHAATPLRRHAATGRSAVHCLPTEFQKRETDPRELKQFLGQRLGLH